MFYLADIVQYFKYLCEQHPLLLHADTPGQRVYEVRGLEDAFASIRNTAKQKDYLVRLLMPTMGLSNGADADHSRKGYQVGLLVLRYNSSREAPDSEVVAAANASEKIADQMISRLLSDSREGYPPFQHLNSTPESLDLSGEVVLRALDGSYSGVMYIFSLRTTRNVRSECQPTSWADGGATPWPLP